MIINFFMYEIVLKQIVILLNWGRYSGRFSGIYWNAMQIELPPCRTALKGTFAATVANASSHGTDVMERATAMTEATSPPSCAGPTARRWKITISITEVTLLRGNILKKIAISSREIFL